MKKILISLLLILLCLFAFISLRVNILNDSNRPLPLKSLSQPMEIMVNTKLIVPSFVKVTISPPLEHLVSFDYSNQIIIINPQVNAVYEYDQQYFIEVNYLGRNLGQLTFHSPLRPATESLEENDREIALNYPLAAYLPYETDQLTVDYSGPRALRLTTNLSEGKAINLVKEFARSKYVDIANHTFELIKANNN